MVSGETEFSIPDIDYIFFESFSFSLFALLVWLYLLIAKKYVYNPFILLRSSRKMCVAKGVLCKR